MRTLSIEEIDKACQLAELVPDSGVGVTLYPHELRNLLNEILNLQFDLEQCRLYLELYREAFLATKAYHSNNTGENAIRYREAIKNLPKNWQKGK